jgi:hypothetical protein
MARQLRARRIMSDKVQTAEESEIGAVVQRMLARNLSVPIAEW